MVNKKYRTVFVQVVKQNVIFPLVLFFILTSNRVVIVFTLLLFNMHTRQLKNPVDSVKFVKEKNYIILEKCFGRARCFLTDTVQPNLHQNGVIIIIIRYGHMDSRRRIILYLFILLFLLSLFSILCIYIHIYFFFKEKKK